MSDAEKIEILRKTLLTVEAILKSVRVPSGQPEVSRAFVDIRGVIQAAYGEVFSNGDRPND
jgi:hypothetical protein